MKTAYQAEAVLNLTTLKETKRWFKHGLLDAGQFAKIRVAYQTPLYHPNLLIRLLLFVATVLALSGVTGLFFLFLGEMGETALYTAAVVYGVDSFYALEKLFIKNNHYKSGVTEAVMYHACGFIIGGFFDFNPGVILIVSCLVFCFAAIRYLDLVCTLATMLAFAGLLFYQCYQGGGVFRQIIPFVFIIVFSIFYLVIRQLGKNSGVRLWRNNLMVVETICLLLIYLGGNYLVVRELSIALMGLVLDQGQDIPFAFLFYALTAVIPLGFLYLGIRNKNRVVLRVSLIVLAASVFTFKYYYNMGHPEITLTIAGAVLVLISITLFHYLRIMRNGFTRENLLTEKWGAGNLEGFIDPIGGLLVKLGDFLLEALLVDRPYLLQQHHGVPVELGPQGWNLDVSRELGFVELRSYCGHYRRRAVVVSHIILDDEHWSHPALLRPGDGVQVGEVYIASLDAQAYTTSGAGSTQLETFT